MKIHALHQFSVTLPVTSSPVSLWARLTRVAIDAEAIAQAEERKPVSPLCIPSLGTWRWDEGSSEITLWLWQVGCRRSPWSLEPSNLHREAQGSSWPQDYWGSSFLVCFLPKSLKAGFSSALHLFPPHKIGVNHQQRNVSILSALSTVIAGRKTTSLLDATLMVSNVSILLQEKAFLL